jgi:transcriptional regulator of acetoin/glycerol metabolism
MRLAADSDLTMCWWHLSLAKNRVTRRRSNRSQTQNLSLQVLELEETVAASDSTVLLLGETGTGKELIARALHDRSRRKQRTLVKLNCAAIPSGLLESELFGHERGAFTGAISQKIGRLELADQGCCFWTKSGISPWSCNRNCCASCRSGNSSAWAVRGRGGSTCGWWRRPIATYRE